MSSSTSTLQRAAVRGLVALTALVMLGACSSSGSSFNPFNRKGDAAYERDRQRGEQPRNQSESERRKRGGQDSSRLTPLGESAPTLPA
jgi:hypothetical protein